MTIPVAVIYRVDPPDDEQQACSKHISKVMRYVDWLLAAASQHNS